MPVRNGWLAVESSFSCKITTEKAVERYWLFMNDEMHLLFAVWVSSVFEIVTLKIALPSFTGAGAGSGAAALQLRVVLRHRQAVAVQRVQRPAVTKRLLWGRRCLPKWLAA